MCRPDRRLICNLECRRADPATRLRVQGQAPLADDRDAQIAHGYSGNVLSQLPVLDLNHQQVVEMMTAVTLPAPGPSPELVNGNSNPPGTTAANINQATNSNCSSILVNPQMSRTWNTNGQPAQANNQRLDGP